MHSDFSVDDSYDDQAQDHGNVLPSAHPPTQQNDTITPQLTPHQYHQLLALLSTPVSGNGGSSSRNDSSFTSGAFLAGSLNEGIFGPW